MFWEAWHKFSFGLGPRNFCHSGLTYRILNVTTIMPNHCFWNQIYYCMIFTLYENGLILWDRPKPAYILNSYAHCRISNNIFNFVTFLQNKDDISFRLEWSSKAEQSNKSLAGLKLATRRSIFLWYSHLVLLPQGTEALVVVQAYEIQPLPDPIFHTSSSTLIFNTKAFGLATEARPWTAGPAVHSLCQPWLWCITN